VDSVAFEHHLTSPQGLDHEPTDGYSVQAGGGACCDRIRISVSIDGERVRDAGFSAEGCGAACAAASAAVSLARGAPILEAARIGSGAIASELGGLSPGKLHAADLAADVLARALGRAVRDRGALRPPVDGRTLVAMSGGVDSAVAALRCAEDGETAAVTLELWSDPENDGERSCCSASAVAQARALAHRMDLPHFTIDLRQEFRRGVVEPFIAGYAGGETPNPCVGCNGHVRLDAMLALADRLGCRQLASGHYARITERQDQNGPLLQVAVDRAKDQSYMLAALSAQSLARMRFPLGDLTKPQVRELAADAGLPVAGKADSQDLCFLAGTGRARFLARHGGLGDRPGEIVDERGQRLGAHHGQHHFTVGQRRGLGIAGGAPLFVLDKDAARNRVTVGPRSDLASRRVRLRSVQLRRPSVRINNVMLRYHTAPVPARADTDAGPGPHRSLSLHLERPFDGPAPGQLACLMDGDVVVGWGTITRYARH